MKQFLEISELGLLKDIPKEISELRSKNKELKQCIVIVLTISVIVIVLISSTNYNFIRKRDENKYI